MCSSASPCVDARCCTVFIVFFFSGRAKTFTQIHSKVSSLGFMSKPASCNTMYAVMLWCSAVFSLYVCVCVGYITVAFGYVFATQCCEILRSCCDKKPHCLVGICGVPVHKLADNNDAHSLRRAAAV